MHSQNPSNETLRKYFVEKESKNVHVERQLV